MPGMIVVEGVRHFSLAKVGEILGVSRATVRRHIEAGRLEVVKVNGVRMVTEMSLRDLLERPRPQDATREQGR